MSAQTGTPSFVPSPPSSRAVDKAKVSLLRVRSNPNPIWIRELRQSGRMGRTPFILMIVTAAVALFMSVIGGTMSVASTPATTGITMFHLFFSVAFFVVNVVGPALAANSVASEREGRTWEAVILTGLSPKTIAWGKFLSAFTSISLYIVMLAPVGALCFLFGGVTALEVAVAFFFLFLFAVLSVAFGLTISSALASGRAAILLTVLTAFPLTFAAFLGGGVGLSFLIHEVWPTVQRGAPIWLPTAYERAPFSIEYVIFLVVIPIATIVASAWFFYEVTIANITSLTDDRATGLKRWFVTMTPMIVVAAVIASAIAPTSNPDEAFASALVVLLLFLQFGLFVFQGDAIGPSRRVIIHWDRKNAGWLTRFFGPGLMKTMLLIVVMGIASSLVVGLAGVVVSYFSPHVTIVPSIKAQRVVVALAYVLSYFLFVAGFATWVRTRTSTAGIARVWLVLASFVVTAGPWVIAAIAGVLTDGSHAAMVVGAPSPFFTFVLNDAMTSSPHKNLFLSAAGVSWAAWSLIGLGLFVAAASRAKAIVHKHHALLAEADALLDQEDEAAQAEVANDPNDGANQQPEPEL